ncbi:MAG: fumarylacetoacetate hydrolase family protein [Betaproteobacteria bacterium]|nr:fumarylacetoacetate hydrolase family protein [Betaproteobacteria bacterium]
MTKSVPWYDPRIVRGMAAQLTRWHERLRAGEKALGWKVGFGAPAAMEKLKIGAPLVGHLTDKALLHSGKALSLAGWKRPVAEPEIAVCIGKDLPRGAGRDAIQAAIAALAPAIELVDLDSPPEEVETILAGNIYQRHVILGPRDTSRAGCLTEGLHARVIRNGTEIADTAEPQAATGDYVEIVRHVADLLAAFGERLRAGQFIITGSIIPPLFVEPGEDIEFRLDPVGAVSVHFAAQPRA